MDIAQIEKEISKKKQFRACDACRKCKKKCDGLSPCSRCKENSSICTYSPRASTKRLTISHSVKKQVTSSAISDTALRTHYIELYFRRINPASLYADFDLDSFNKPKSKAVLMQYNAVLATATRAFADQRVYKNFETRAKQLASELIEDFSFDAAIGFHILAFHLWGENEDIACHYRDITMSICERLARTEKRKGNPIGHVYKLQMAASIINYVGESDFSLLEDTVAKLLETQNVDAASSPVAMLMVAKFQAKLWNYLFKDSDDPEYHTNPFKAVTAEQHQELSTMMSQFESVLNGTFLLSEQTVLVIAVVNIFKAMMYYSGGKSDSAIFHCEQAAGILEKNLHLAPFCSPFVSTICHITFLIAFREANYVLANRIIGFSRKIAELLPSSRDVMEKDMEMLRSVSVEKSSIKPPSFSFVPPAPLHTNMFQCFSTNEPKERISRHPSKEEQPQLQNYANHERNNNIPVPFYPVTMPNKVSLNTYKQERTPVNHDFTQFLFEPEFPATCSPLTTQDDSFLADLLNFN